MGSEAPSAPAPSSGAVVALFANGVRETIELAQIPGVTEDPRERSYRQLGLIASGAPALTDPHLRTLGLESAALTLGRRLRVGARAVVQVTLRADGVTFARVLRGGAVTRGDAIGTDAALDRPRFAVVTLSDRSAAGARPDESGPLAASILQAALGAPPCATSVLADDAAMLARRLVELADEELCDLIVTTGGTGLAPRDVTPEATLAVIEREVPGIAEAIRAGSLSKTPFAMLSRAVCGQRGSALIVNLSGSPKAVREQLAILLPVLSHVLTTASGVTQSCATLDLSHGPR